MQNVTPVIVLDGTLKSALAVVRSLGRQQVPVVVGAERRSGMALHSRYAQHHFVYPSPLIDRAAFIRYVKAEAVRLQMAPIVYALSDATATALHAHRAELLPYMHFASPEAQSLEIVTDKAVTYSFAKVHGIPTVESYPIFGVGDIERIKNTIVFPVVVKPRKSVSWLATTGRYGSAQFVFSKEELVQKYQELTKRNGEPPLVQPYTEGDEYGVALLAHKGQPYAVTTHKRLRSLAPTGGASVLKETMCAGDLRTELEMYAYALTKQLAWEGPIMFEFKVDTDTRKALLMEINGRFWGSLPLSVFAGVDMPYLYYRSLAYGEIPVEVKRCREGVVSRHYLGDVRNLWSTLTKRDPMRTRSYPKRRQAIREFFAHTGDVHADVWDAADVWPAYFELIDMVYKCIWK